MKQKFEARIEKLKKQAARDHAQRVADENEERFERMLENEKQDHYAQVFARGRDLREEREAMDCAF